VSVPRDARQRTYTGDSELSVTSVTSGADSETDPDPDVNSDRVDADISTQRSTTPTSTLSTMSAMNPGGEEEEEDGSGIVARANAVWS